MKALTIFVTFLIMFLFSVSVSAQFDLGKKLKKKIEKEVDKATDDAIDKTVEAVKKGGKDKNEETDQKDAKKNENPDNNLKTEIPAKTDNLEGSSFEGKVIFDLEENGNEQVIAYYSKDKKYLMEMPEKGGAILFNANLLKMYVLMHKEKKYMETAMMPMSASGAGSLSKTSETKSILGYHCEKFLFEQKDQKGEAWMTSELGAFMFFMESQNQVTGWQKEVLDAGYFPLHVTEYNLDGEVKSVFSVKEVTPMKLNADLFTIPSSYEKIDLTNMGGLENLIGQ
jgi:hypothetical protein